MDKDKTVVEKIPELPFKTFKLCYIMVHLPFKCLLFVFFTDAQHQNERL